MRYLGRWPVLLEVDVPPTVTGPITYEDWTRGWDALRQLAEARAEVGRLREAAAAKSSTAVDVTPAMPDAMASNGSIQEAWARFHSMPRPPRIRRESPVRRPRIREMRTLVGDGDPSGWPEDMR